MRTFFSIVCIVFFLLAPSYFWASEDIFEENEGDFTFTTQSIEQIHFDWIYSTALIMVYFNDGSLKQGFGLLLENGLYLTSSNLTYQAGLYPKKIFAKMQDDSAKPIMCVASLDLQAMDSSKGLTLLKTSAFTDSHCKIRPQSYYHKRIYDKYAQDIFAPFPTKDLISQEIYFPTIQSLYTFEIQKTTPKNEKSYYDKQNQKIIYGYSLELNTSYETDYGKPYFDKKGRFIGIFSVTDYSNGMPIIVTRKIAQDFINAIKKKNIDINLANK